MRGRGILVQLLLLALSFGALSVSDGGSAEGAGSAVNHGDLYEMVVTSTSLVAPPQTLHGRDHQKRLWFCHPPRVQIAVSGSSCPKVRLLSKLGSNPSWRPTYAKTAQGRSHG